MFRSETEMYVTIRKLLRIIQNKKTKIKKQEFFASTMRSMSIQSFLKEKETQTILKID